MAIVEDEVRNDSEEENEIEVYVEEDDADQDSEDSDDDDDDDDDEDEEDVQKKIAELEQRIEENPYNYDDHISLIHELWGISDLEKWRTAFCRLQEMTILRAEHWQLRLKTEESFAHSSQSHKFIGNLFQQATLDCYSIPILNQWCSWALSIGSPDLARDQMEYILTMGGADPFSGKLLWGARLELEKTQLESLSEDHADYKEQKRRVLWCLEEMVSRPLLRGEEAWPLFQDLAMELHDAQYVEKVRQNHEAAIEYLEKIRVYEDKLMSLDKPKERYKVYWEYIEAVKDLSTQEKYEECGSHHILKVLYERASTECLSCEGLYDLLFEYWSHVQETSSRATKRRVLKTCVRRCPRKQIFWTLRMVHAEADGEDFEEIKSIFESALAKGMESYKEAEALWMSYLEHCRRKTDFEKESEVERLRSTFRLAWDSLAEAWGQEANDCEVPVFWAQLEYKRLNSPKQGKEIFEEIFKYGENKTLSKYWEALLHLERAKGGSESKLRDLYKRAVLSVMDYPPAVAGLWTDFERAWGTLETAVQCSQICEKKISEWRKNYQLKGNMMGAKQKGKKVANKKGKFDNKNKGKGKPELKRKSETEEVVGSQEKRKRDSGMNDDDKAEENDSGGGLKRPRDDNDDEATENKRQRIESGSSSKLSDREACTLFISNLEFNPNDENLKDILSEFGEIVSMRVKTGVKAFGGSICYCQYESPESVEEALKHDRTPLDGRPMFFSRYAANNEQRPMFKYATTAEKNKLFVRNLPFGQCTKEALTVVFEKYGTLKDIRIVTYKDGKPKGLAYVEYEDEKSASEALKATDGLQLSGREIRVALSEPPPKTASASASASAPPTRTRRTQLSSFIPSVLQKATVSNTTGSGKGDHNGDNAPLTNADFRNMLLKK